MGNPAGEYIGSSDMKVQRQQRNRMIRGTGKTQKKTAERRQKQHRLKSRHSTRSNAA